MKRFLLYVIFWILAFIVSAIIGVTITTYSIYDVMALSGRGDPQLMAGMISEQLVGWAMTAILVSVFVYPLYFVLKSKVRFPSLIALVIFYVTYAILALINGLSLTNLFVSMFIQTIFCPCLFIFCGLVFPGIILRKLEKKRIKS